MKESTLEEKDVRPQGRSALPPGARNFITAAGKARLEAERDRLSRERAGAAADERSRIDERLRPLEQSLRTAEVVGPPPPEERDWVRFGAAVTVRGRGGDRDTYRIVGVDEADPAAGAISYLSPLAQALLNARVGQRVSFRFPKGQIELEITEVRYPHGGEVKIDRAVT